MALDINDYEPALRYGALLQTGDIADQAITTPKIIGGNASVSRVVDTNGTTRVDVFGSTNGFAGTITSFIAVSKDNTAGTISVYSTSTGATITTFAKGAQPGVVTGGTIVAATAAFASTGTMQAVSTTAGNVLLIATYLTA